MNTNTPLLTLSSPVPMAIKVKLTTTDPRVGDDCGFTPLISAGHRVRALVHALGSTVEGNQTDPTCHLCR